VRLRRQPDRRAAATPPRSRSSRRAPRCTSPAIPERPTRRCAKLQRDTAAITASNPYSGVTNEEIVNYLAGTVEQRILQMQTADPGRTPSYTIFPQPDYYFDSTFLARLLIQAHLPATQTA
jgi:hypothetical protein